MRLILSSFLFAALAGCVPPEDVDEYLGRLVDRGLPGDIGPPADSSVLPSNGCTHDADGDEFGEGCALGLDCDDLNSSVHPGHDEICDDLDNDCDGVADEQLNVGGDCMVGDGICRVAGLIECQFDGLARCAAGEEISPRLETCNGLDDDCDGLVDEEVDGEGSPCNAGQCGEGSSICVNGALTCRPINPVGPELCNNQDDDCDGAVDEGGTGGQLTRDCYYGPVGTEGVGQCSTGTEVCLEGVYQACYGQILPSEEFCDGADNDCDSRLDEAVPFSGELCSQGTGACYSEGELACDPFMGLVCDAQIGLPIAELCNLSDDDCDGFVDESPTGGPLLTSCYDGPEGTEAVGACSSGNRTCWGGEFGACEGQQLPFEEQCNGLDDDCDGEVDEQVPGEGVGCVAGTGACAADGIIRCEFGMGMVCTAQPADPTDEKCDGIDNDCDSIVDEFCMHLDAGIGDSGVDDSGVSDGGAQ